MFRLILITFCLGTATPVLAQDTSPVPEKDMQEGMDLMSEGMELLLRGLMGEMEPAMRELREAIDDLNAYHPPEVLPNGDIIIRRKVPLEVDPPEDGEIDL